MALPFISNARRVCNCELQGTLRLKLGWCRGGTRLSAVLSSCACSYCPLCLRMCSMGLGGLPAPCIHGEHRESCTANWFWLHHFFFFFFGKWQGDSDKCVSEVALIQRIWAILKRLNKRCLTDPQTSVPSHCPLIHWLVLVWCKSLSSFRSSQPASFSWFWHFLNLGCRWTARHRSPYRYRRARSKHGTSSTLCTFSWWALPVLLLQVFFFYTPAGGYKKCIFLGSKK